MKPKYRMAMMFAVILAAILSSPAFGFYSPQEGRWLSRDPTGEGGGVNLYLSFRNAPAFILDRYGLCTVGETEWRDAGHSWFRRTCSRNFSSVSVTVSGPFFSYPSPDTPGPGVNFYFATGSFSWEQVHYEEVKQRMYNCECTGKGAAFVKQSKSRWKNEITGEAFGGNGGREVEHRILVAADLGDKGEYGIETEKEAFAAVLEERRTEFERMGTCPEFDVWHED